MRIWNPFKKPNTSTPQVENNTAQNESDETKNSSDETDEINEKTIEPVKPIVDLYNKKNRLEKIIKANEDFNKLRQVISETDYEYLIDFIKNNEYQKFVDKLNEIVTKTEKELLENTNKLKEERNKPTEQQDKFLLNMYIRQIENDGSTNYNINAIIEGAFSKTIRLIKNFIETHIGEGNILNGSFPEELKDYDYNDITFSDKNLNGTLNSINRQIEKIENEGKEGRDLVKAAFDLEEYNKRKRDKERARFGELDGGKKRRSRKQRRNRKTRKNNRKRKTRKH